MLPAWPIVFAHQSPATKDHFILGLLSLGFVFVLGAIILLCGLYLYFLRKRIFSWVQCPATVVHKEIAFLPGWRKRPSGVGLEHQRMFTLHVVYTYMYQGHTYTRNRLHPQNPIGRRKAHCEKIIRQFPQNFMVYVNPAEPSEAYQGPPPKWAMLLTIFSGLAICYLTGFIMITELT